MFALSATAETPPPKAAKASAECLNQVRSTDTERWFCVGAVAFDATTGRKLTEAPVARHQESSPVTVQDDYDWWCEDQAICDRSISDYIMETKANYVYGYVDSNGNVVEVGQFDAVIRVNLNGRSARFSQTLIWDSGPGIYFPRVYVECYEEINLLPDNHCGTYDSGAGAYIHGGSWRWDGSSQTAPLVNSNEYYLEYHADVRPEGFQTMPLPYFETPLFNCLGSDPCYFP